MTSVPHLPNVIWVCAADLNQLLPFKVTAQNIFPYHQDLVSLPFVKLFLAFFAREQEDTFLCVDGFGALDIITGSHSLDEF